jgi:hypothetical protein
METGATYRYLTRQPGVRDVVGLVVNGSSVDDVVRSFPDLRRSQVYECLAYYEDHRGEIDALIARQTIESQKIMSAEDAFSPLARYSGRGLG